MPRAPAGVSSPAAIVAGQSRITAVPWPGRASRRDEPPNMVETFATIARSSPRRSAGVPSSRSKSSGSISWLCTESRGGRPISKVKTQRSGPPESFTRIGLPVEAAAVFVSAFWAAIRARAWIEQHDVGPAVDIHLDRRGVRAGAVLLDDLVQHPPRVELPGASPSGVSGSREKSTR